MKNWPAVLLERTGVIMHPGYFYDFAQEGFMVCSLLPRTDIFERGIRLFLDHLPSLLK